MFNTDFQLLFGIYHTVSPAVFMNIWNSMGYIRR